MTECENCYHKDVCSGRFDVEEYGCRCEDYKDKSLIIELPCNVGDTVYIVRSQTSNGKNLYIATDRVKRIVTEKATDINYSFTRIEYENIISSYDWEFSNIFVTREEAEKALKEQKN